VSEAKDHLADVWTDEELALTSRAHYLKPCEHDANIEFFCACAVGTLATEARLARAMLAARHTANEAEAVYRYKKFLEGMPNAGSPEKTNR